jgi:hypothetical protein
VTSISPTTVVAGSGPLTLTVNGTGFQSTTTIQAGDVAEVTSYVSATQVSATLTAEQLASGAELPVIALNGTASSGSGPAVNLSVTNPAPVIAALTPAVLPAGSGASTLAVTGSGFVPTTVIDVNGSGRATVFESATQVDVALTAADLASVGSLALTAVNGTPGGGTSAAAALAINNPAPGTAITLSPSNAQVGAATATNVTVTGSNFIPASTVQVNGAARTTTYVSATQVTFQLTVADQATAQLIPVTVVNPAPGGGSTLATTLTVANPAPGSAVTLAPASVAAGTPTPTSMTVTGTGFVSSSSVQVNGAVRATSYVSATQLTFQLTVNDEAIGQLIAVTVTNPTPGGGSSGSANLAINNPTPTISQPVPATVLLGAVSPVVTLAGTGFVPTTVIDVNGQARSTIYVSTTQVQVLLTPADVAATGSLSLTAVNGTPGGGASAATTIAVDNPPPGGPISLSPSMIATGATTPTTITVTGTRFIPTSTIQLGGTVLGSTAVAVPTTYVSATQLTFALTAAQQATAQQFMVSVVNPAPGGGTVGYGILTLYQPMPAPVITQVSPTQFLVGSGDTTIIVAGTNLFPQSGSTLSSSSPAILWNGTALANQEESYSYSGEALVATVPASLLTSVGTATITVNSPESSPAVSNAMTVTIVNPPAPTLTSISPSVGPINTAATVTLNGTGFTSSSTVAVNGTDIAATFVNSTQLTVAVPASSIALPGNLNFTVTTPAPGGGTTAPLPYTAYVGIPNNSMVYNPVNGLLYVSVPSAAGAPYGNSVVSVDPETGALGTPIPVGSEPNRLAISSDGTILWVGLDAASAVRQVNLTTGTAGLQFSLGGNGGLYENPQTALALAVLPGTDNSIVVGTSGGSLAIWDSGVLRGAAMSFSTYALQTNGTTNEIYAGGYGAYAVFTYTASGLTQKGSTAYNGSYAGYSSDDMQLVGGKTYTDFESVYDAEAGALLGTFYLTGTTAAQGPTVADPTLGLVFVLDDSQAYSYGSYNQIQAFSLSSFTSAGSAVISVSVPSATSYSSTPATHLTRWGTNGLAFRTGLGVVSLRSNLVKDLSTVNADLGVTLTASGGTTTGTNTTYTATITDAGPSNSTNVALTAMLPSTGVLVSVTPSSGTCSTGSVISCDLGGIGNGNTSAVTLVVEQTSAGTANMTVQVSGSETDPNTANNQATAAVTVTGSTYNVAPSLSGISPATIEAGSNDTVMTLTGTGFTSASSVLLGSTALSTSYTSSTSLTATVPAAQLANLGWAAITVSNPAPGGGTSGSLPLSVFSVITLGANHILYDPYSQNIMASVGSGSSSVAGNSIVAIAPATATVGTPVAIGSQPENLALTSDGQVLYTLLAGSQSVAVFNMLTQTAEYTYAIQPGTGTDNSPAPRGIATQPGTENMVAIDLGSWAGNAIYQFDPTHKTAAMIGQASGPYSGSCISFLDAGDMLAFDTDTSGATFDHYTVTSAGFTYYDYSQYTESTLNGFGCFKISGGLATANAGGVANPATVPAKQIGVYPVSGGGEFNANLSFAPDASLRSAFYLVNTQSASDNGYTTVDGIESFNQNTFLPTASVFLDMETIEGNTSYTGVDMVRWGQDGLAVLTSGGHIYLLRGAFVVPQLLNANSAATLASSSISSVVHGAGNTLVTLTGSNFIPGVAVTWNGSYRTTTIMDSTHVTVALPASDLASAGTGALVANNPGASASNSLTVSIN